ncbi:MAG: hypothetical protein J6P72_09200 [Firmicutes bacterium]|nr:hypothetical protein [Bacillota bacterium]
MKKYGILVLIISMLLGLLAGCKAADENEENAEASASSEEAAEYEVYENSAPAVYPAYAPDLLVEGKAYRAVSDEWTYPDGNDIRTSGETGYGARDVLCYQQAQEEERILFLSEPKSISISFANRAPEEVTIQVSPLHALIDSSLPTNEGAAAREGDQWTLAIEPDFIYQIDASWLQGDDQTYGWGTYILYVQDPSTTIDTSEMAPYADAWSFNPTSEVTAELKTLFEAGTKSLLGVDYEPLAYLGYQTYQRTRHSYLAKAQVVSPEAKPYLAMICLEEDGEGGVSVLSAQPISVGKLYGSDDEFLMFQDCAAEGAEEALLGGWQVNPVPLRGVSAEKSHEADVFARTGLTEGEFSIRTAVYCLATQVVSGTNYCFLAETDYGGTELYYIYEDLQGEVTLGPSYMVIPDAFIEGN